MPVTVYIGLGSNLGDRRNYLDQAVRLLGQAPGVTCVRVSSYHETEPVGGPAGQGKYLNAVAELRTDLEPTHLLRLLLDIENNLGRVRNERLGPRTLDLDLLLYGQEQIAVKGPNMELIVPHPRMHERLFVLEPLAEIAPLAVHPGQKSTIHDLLRRALVTRASQVSMAGSEGTLKGPVRPTTAQLTVAGSEGTPEGPVRPATARPAGARELTGLRALVTGSTSGIGKAIALALAQGGADVVIHGRRSLERAQDVSRQVLALGVKSTTILADLRDEPGCREVLEKGWQDGLDIWINNAGADTLTGEAARWPFERKLAELWAVDVQATMRLARAVGERMKQRGRGVIINMGWDQAETGMAGESGQLFGAVKGAVMAFSKSLALSLAPQVRVLCLAPGWIRTAWGEQASTAWQERVVRETPLGRWGTPEDVAATVRWLVSPAASFITGQIIRINGGAV